MSGMLSLLDNSSDSEIELTVNKDYANKYNEWRQKEELQKYKDLKKDEEESESSSESSSEEIDEEFDEEFFRALSLLKGKDPRIFDKNFHLFQKKEILKRQKHDKPKPIYMKDYERNLVIERGGKFSDEDESANLSEKVSTYNEEQENLKKSFKEALGSSDDSESDAEDLLQVRNKTIKEEEDAEADYVKWLKGEEKEVSEDMKKDMSHLRNYWNDPKLDEDEKFLRDYILNKRYVEKDDSEIPTYEELTSGMLSDDEKMIAEQEQFEHKYNFRFEEPDEEYIKRYPRTIGDSLRRVDNRRKQIREDKTERKRKEREQRREELKRLKALKRKEIEEKFMKLKEISGQDEINLDEDDIESDFDPDKHDQKMKEMFNDEYYQVEEDQKPEFPYDEELDSENWNAWTGEKIGEESEEEGDSISDIQENSQSKICANPKDDFANEMINAAQPRKKVKKKSLFAKIISQPKPVYDPSGKSFEEYVDEYYKLDYEDIVGDIPVRYKYRKVIPNDFGLTVNEILAADDKELNRWCSVKKACQYRNDDEEFYDVQAFKNKARNPIVKQKLLPSIYAKKDLDDSFEVSNNISKAEKKKFLPEDDNTIDIPSKKEDNVGDSNECNSSEKNITANESFDSSKKPKKKKEKFNVSVSEDINKVPDFLQKKSSDLNKLEKELPFDDDEIGKSVTQSEKLKSKKKNKKLKVSEKSSPVSDFFQSNVDNFSKSDLESSHDEFGQDKEKIQNYGEFKNLKKTKKKFKTSFSESETELKNVLSNESNLNTSTLESFCGDVVQDQGVVHSQETIKKCKKKKPKEELSTSVENFGCNNSNTVSESEYKVANTYSNNSQMTLETSHKNMKRKRKHVVDIFSDSEKCDLTSAEFSKSNKIHPSSDTAESNPNFASTNVSSSLPKKKKKKNKSKRNMLNNNTHNGQDDASNPSFKKSKNKYKSYASEDKRLGLSDERLAAYGINPKKFKNRIIYAKK